jgi:flap endonuclease-1
MGIHKLMSLIDEKAPNAVKEIQLETLTGKVVAIDASMAIYQFLISTQTLSKGFGVVELKDKDGNLTGHLVGLLNRSLALLEHGVKPVWVFDGKAPDLKSGELEERKEKKMKAKEDYDKAMEDGNIELAQKAAQRSVRVSPEMTADAKELLRLSGIPVVEAPSEAEAQCAQMVKDKLAYATVTEDMDALTFGTTVLLRGFGNKKDPIRMITLSKVLEEFELDMDEFIDLCILCGCDYTGSISGVGPVKAFNYIKSHKTIEGVIEAVEKENEKRKKKLQVPENFNYIGSRGFFKDPEVTKKENMEELKWQAPDEEGLKTFLTENKGFSETTFVNAINKFKKCKGKSNQKRLDSFFTIGTKKSTSNITPVVKPSKGKGRKK